MARSRKLHVWTGLFQNLKADNYLNTFIINGICSALTTGIAIQVQLAMNPVVEKYKIDEGLSLLITMGVTFTAAFLSYLLLYIIWGYNGGSDSDAIKKLTYDLEEVKKILNNHSIK